MAIGALMIGVSAARVHLRFESRSLYNVGLGMSPEQVQSAFAPPSAGDFSDPLPADRLRFVSHSPSGLHAAEFKFRRRELAKIRLVFTPDSSPHSALRDAGFPENPPDGVFQHNDGQARVFVEDQGLSIVYARPEEFLNVPKRAPGIEKTSP